MNNTIDNMISDIMAARAAGRTVNSRTGDVTIDMTTHGLNAGPNHGLNAGPNHGLNAGQDPTNPIIIDLVDLVDQDRDHDQVIGKGTYSVVKIINGHAVKIIQNSDSFSSAIREICLLGKLDHPNVIKCNGIGFNFEETHMFMKLYHYSLFTCIKSCNVRLNNFGVVVGIIENILQALTYIHERGIIHCDVKPENILLEELENGFLSAVLCDFGISVLVNEVMHIASVQTTTYRAPEIAFHRDIIKFTPAIDMWSLGCLLFNLFTLKPFVEYAINQSGDYIEDPTWYACKGLNIQGCNTWGTRKKMLRSVNMPYIMFALEHRIDNEVLYCRLYVSGLLQLCAQCFYPNPTKRITAACGLTIVRCISGVKTIYYPPCPRVWTNTKTVDSMRCLRNIIIDVIMSCSARCLNLAEIIYCITLRYEINCPYVEQFSSACIYIASAIYSGESHIVRIINGCDDKKKIIEAVGAILIAIYNDSINVNVATTLANMTGGYY